MEIIRQIQLIRRDAKKSVRLCADRGTLAKRRWRGLADDGQEFGFDLAQPLADGTFFFETESSVYEIVQRAEPLLEVQCGEASGAARLGWMIGNLHFPVEICGDVMLVQDDPAVRNLFERERIAFSAVEKVFHPLKSVSPHAH